MDDRHFVGQLADVYMTLKSKVIDAGFAAEIDWQEELSFDQVSERSFLREAGWVILSSGMRETVIRQKFPMISEAFLEWESAEAIVSNRVKCCEEAMRHFGHRKKIDAIATVAEHVFENGFDSVSDRIAAEGVDYITQLPYMGPATSYHFAKNIGLGVVKPDRHLQRIAKTVGYETPSAMCKDIAELTAEKEAVVDIVLWRFAAITTGYLEHFDKLSSLSLAGMQVN